jgi:hypothetical protein
MTTAEWEKLFRYCETSPTGLRWKVDGKTSKRKSGDVAGWLWWRKTDNRKSWMISVWGDGKVNTRLVHRLVYELAVGPIPEGLQIDHMDGNPLNNKKENLRAVTQTINLRNKRMYKCNKSGVVGVNFQEKHKRWCCTWATLDCKGRKKYFYIDEHGNDEAFRLACEYRAARMAELNEAGAGYTERHGVEQ